MRKAIRAFIGILILWSATAHTARALSVTNNTPWLDNTLPAGAISSADGGDWWNWVTANPTPFSGSTAVQSTLASGLHQLYFMYATRTLAINPGETLYVYAYIDPANPPSELMVQWNDGSWDHRAYWGANSILWGTDGTAGRRYMGPIPAGGQWVRLEVPASQVGLEGSTVTGLALTLYNGRVTWDAAGKAAVVVTNTPTSTASNDVAWVDDSVPAGAVVDSTLDTWNWVSSNPTPFSGAKAHQSAASAGFHQHFFANASQTLRVSTGDVLYAYVYLDPNNPPSELMLQWNNGSWEHRAYWGANNLLWGTDGTATRRSMGQLPAAGQWARLEVPASQVGLEGASLNGMAFTLSGGRATWDSAGKASSAATNPGGNGSTNTTGGGTSTNTTSGGTNSQSSTSATNSVTWIEDNLPTGALPDTAGGDSWSWVSSNPSPYAGSSAHQSAIAAGFHQHYFSSATSMLGVSTGDVLFAYVYIDPNNVPSEVMLQWNNGSWEHRAYWGANNLLWGTDATATRRNMGPLPAAGQWARLEVPASQVGLEGANLNGMAFTLFGGRATFDHVGKASVAGAGSTNIGTGTGTGTNSGSGSTGSTNTSPGGSTNSIPITNTPPDNLTNSSGGSTNILGGGTNSTSGTNATIATSTNSIPGLSIVDDVTLQLPPVGANGLHILSPTLLELKYINTKQLDPAPVPDWNLVDANGNFTAPPASAFTVTVNGQTIPVTAVGFKRRPLYAPFWTYDLRIENSLYLQLGSPISDNQAVEVKNPSGSIWRSSLTFAATANPLRYGPPIHVNQEGYMPGSTKKAMVGYYLGNMGEMTIPSSAGFKLVDTASGATVYQGTLAVRGDTGWQYSATPYQKVYEADFTSFNTPGEYRLVVPGLGGSLPFLIDNGIAMSFTRAYALGLYHQRCGTNTEMPYTRFSHDKCHSAAASVPWPASSYPFTWTTVANYALQFNSDNAPQVAPPMNATSQLYPFIRQGTLDVSGGHHDAGDYSKYTENCANLVHYLMFAVDSLPGVAAMDNLGIPESGDGISDVLQEAKWEADFIAKIQDTDGGFYFLVYPVNREYESTLPGDPQVVWPKTTSVTAAAVAALAQCGSSPAFKAAYPQAAAAYMQKAQLGWQFLTNAIARYGKNGAYQKITHYSDEFADQDELAWAACQIFLATGDQAAHQMLLSWFDPSNPATWRWGWVHCFADYGHAIRSYAFGAQSGRVAASQLNSTFLTKCQNEVIAAGDAMMNFSQQSAYGTSFPTPTKAVSAAGWYFSCDNAFDIAVAYQLNPKPAYMTAMLANMNYEGGCNPVNVTYVTGLGWRRQREIVSQWAMTDNHVLPPSGIPSANIVSSFFYLSTYGTEIENLVYPTDANGVSNPYPFYDRFIDGWNVSGEFTVQNSARALGTLGFLAGQTALKSQPWRAVAGQILVPPAARTGSPAAVSLQAPAGMDLSGARVVWEARGQEPAFGPTFNFTPNYNGTAWIEAEAQWPDGRRVFAVTNFTVTSSNSVWVDDSVPANGNAGGEGGDSWNWVSSSPTPYAGRVASQSGIAAGVHQHFFLNATDTLAVNTGDVLYAYVYIDPANLPSEVMLQWYDGSWDHRAYWGANNITYGANDTVGRHSMGALPAAGQWVRLEVPASQVGLEGRTINGMAFTLFGGRATWDAAGRISQSVVAGRGGAPAPAVASLQMASAGPTVSWNSTSGSVYQVKYKDNLGDPSWLTGGNVTSRSSSSSWVDANAANRRQRFYLVAQLE